MRTDYSVINVNGTIFFAGDDLSAGNREVWKTNGTVAGTTVLDFTPGIHNETSPRSLTNINGTIYFAALMGTFDLELWAFSSLIGVHEIKGNDQNMIVRPNPFSDRTVISLQTRMEGAVAKVYNMLGNEVETIEFSGQDFILEKANKKPGIYSLRIMDSGKGIISKKLVIE